MTVQHLHKAESTDRVHGNNLGYLLSEAFQNSHLDDITSTLDENTITLHSEDGLEGINIVFAPSCQVYYHFATRESIKLYNSCHYISVGRRAIDPAFARRILVCEFKKLLASRQQFRQSHEDLFSSDSEPKCMDRSSQPRVQQELFISEMRKLQKFG